VPIGSFRDLNTALKRISRLPVIAFGRIKGPDLAAEIIEKGEADLIGWARQLIADPETPNKIQQGRSREIRYCTSCNDACVYQVVQDRGIRCIHNPDAGNETTFTLRTMPTATQPKTIVVVGGGPAGLKVAETAARRGHQVKLFERSDRLGGQVALAARQPTHEEILEVISFLEREVSRLGVDVRLGCSMSAEELQRMAADVVVVATGSEPNLPPRGGEYLEQMRSLAEEWGISRPPDIPGLDSESIFSVDEVLSGHVKGQSAVVIDGNGHWEAAGTIEYLADAGIKVEAITAAAVVGANMEGTSHVLLYQRLAKKGVKIIPFTRLVSVNGNRALVADIWSGSERSVEADMIVPVTGRRSRDEIYLKLANASGGVGAHIERVGDCVSPKLIQNNIADAYALGRGL
jgi:NADPH-dependent 2,4-dienoyl-CoA reductase/sulfur reductase-like enzyme